MRKRLFSYVTVNHYTPKRKERPDELMFLTIGYYIDDQAFLADVKKRRNKLRRA